MRAGCCVGAGLCNGLLPSLFENLRANGGGILEQTTLFVGRPQEGIHWVLRGTHNSIWQVLVGVKLLRRLALVDRLGLLW